MYSSPDLAHWTDRGHVVKARSCKFCFRPHTVYDKATGKYVMWVNDQEAADRFRVYTADRPTGPFTEQPVPDLPAGTHCTADLDVFVDDDGTGYLACSNAGWHIARRLAIPPSVVLHRLPPCTPELQPAEPLWPLLREAVANEGFDELEEMEPVLVERCRWLIDHPEAVRGAVGFGWAVALNG